MTKTVKTENYTADMVAVMRTMFEAGKASGEKQKDIVAKVAEKLGKGVRSVVAKASREGFYEKAEYAAKDGTKAESKADIVANIATALGVAPEVVGSLESATKQALKAVLAGL